MLNKMKQGLIEWVIAYAMTAVILVIIYAGCIAYETLTKMVMF